jgi:hypothetical protein
MAPVPAANSEPHVKGPVLAAKSEPHSKGPVLVVSGDPSVKGPVSVASSEPPVEGPVPVGSSESHVKGPVPVGRSELPVKELPGLSNELLVKETIPETVPGSEQSIKGPPPVASHEHFVEARTNRDDLVDSSSNTHKGQPDGSASGHHPPHGYGDQPVGRREQNPLPQLSGETIPTASLIEIRYVWAASAQSDKGLLLIPNLTTWTQKQCNFNQTQVML